MTYFVLSLLLVIGTYYMVSNVKLLVEQYYTFSRFLKVKRTELRQQWAYFASDLLFFVLSAVCYFFYDTLWGCVLMLLSYYIFFTELRLKGYRFTRRNILLLSVAVAMMVSVMVFVYLQINEFVAVCFMPLIAVLCLFFAHLLLLPIERFIAGFYIRRARQKVVRNGYVVIGITGSFGKTTMKNLLYSLLKVRFRIARQNHNYNTLMGLSRYINCEVGEEDDILLVELGVDHPRSMTKFGRLFRLDYAVVTSVGEMHLATFRSVENIAREKLRIASLLKEGGQLLVSREIAKKYSEQLPERYQTFSESELEAEGEFSFVLRYRNTRIETPLVHSFQLAYLSAAIKIAESLGAEPMEILYGLKHLELPSRRLQIHRKGELTIIDDSYNANRSGFLTDLHLLLQTDGYHIVFTGGLIELGKKYEAYNEEIGRALSDADMVVLISKERNHPLKRGYQLKKAHVFYQVASMKEAFGLLNGIREKAVLLLTAKGYDDVLH